MATGRNLTQTAAVERADLIDVSTYDISIDLADEAGAPLTETFRSSTTVIFTCHRPGESVIIDAGAERLVSASLNGVEVPLTNYTPGVGLLVPDLTAENVLTVVGDYEFTSGKNGMYRTVDPADGEAYLYTSFEPASAQTTFACFDQPDLKATFTIRTRIPGLWTAISNMPEAGREPDLTGAVTVHFEPTPKMSTYLAVLCAGPYVGVRSTVNGRDLSVYCRPSMVEFLDEEVLFDLTRRGMDFYEEQFGQPYPLPKYDHVAAPGYMGAMENFGCIVFSERLLIFRSQPTEEQLTLRGVILLHELAHMWFGDLVTMRWWDDLWLNEAFATWASYWAMAEATDIPDPWAIFALQVKKDGIEADQLTSTHPVCADIPNVEATETNFDAITYRKGASVLKQLTAYVGRDAFVTALRAYFADRAWGNATFDDLLEALVAASGRPVREFATEWLNTSQVNTLRPQVSVDDEGRYTEVAVLQEAPADHPHLRTHRLAIGLYDLDADGQLRRRERVELDVAGERTEVAQLRGVAAPDLLLLNDDDLTYAKVRLDERSLSTVVKHIGGLDSPLARAICWGAAGDMLVDAELRARDYIDMVVGGLRRETSSALAFGVLTTAEQALDLYADPAYPPVGWDRIAQLGLEGAQTSEPGSSLQLLWVRDFAVAARSPEYLAVLRSWYDETALPEGVKLDTDLRWQLLQGLVRGGAAGPAEIEAEAERDRSLSGDRQAWVTRALVPTVEGKAAAWRMVVEESEIPLENRIHSGFFYGHPAHAALVPTHVADFLSIVDSVYTVQGRDVGRAFVMAAFPRGQVSEETLAAIDAWSAGEHPAAVARGISEGRDQIARALRARTRDRS
jgi:aminopeptidase N